MSLVYLAAPADQTGQLTAKPWWQPELHRISFDLSEAGHDVYRPTLAFSGGQLGAGIQSVNRAALAAADGGVALIPAGVPTLGVPAEVDQLLGLRRPVLIVTDLDRSVQLRDWERRGALVVYCSDEGVAHGLLRLQREMVRQAEELAAAGGVPELVFQPIGFKTVARTSDDIGPWDPDQPVTLLPGRGYPGDAGLDLVVSADTKVAAGQFADVPCGVKADIPPGTFGLILGRSSTLRKRGLMVSPGVIDEGWTGPLFAGVQNLTSETVVVRSGERVAQLLLLPALAAGYAPVWGQVPAKQRGDNGFGSTGA